MDCYADRFNAGMMRDPSGNRIRMARAGSPDIIGALPGGAMFGLEAKSTEGRQSPAQREWQEMAARQGIRYALVRSVGEAKAALVRWVEEVRNG